MLFQFLVTNFSYHQETVLSKEINASEATSVNITNNKSIQFIQPEFNFGQKVKTKAGYRGYIVGLDFYPENRTWSYGVYFPNSDHEFIKEIGTKLKN